MATVISESLLHQWSDQGSTTVRDKLQHALDALHDKTGKRDALYRLLYELVWIVLQAKLTRQDVLALLKDAGLHKSTDASDVLTDLIWVIGNEVEAKEKGRERHSSSEWQALSRLVKDLAEEEIVPALTLKSSLEVDLLHDAGLLPEPALMSRKLVRVNTKTYYTQVKFNLLREESEGFAKVLSLLHTGVTTEQLAASKTDLMALIGFFDLDANRVLDLVLDAYEMHPHNDGYLELLELFKRDSIPHVLGFKFQFYKRDDAAVADDGRPRATPRSLYRLAATLVEKRVIDVDALLPHLAPSKDETVQRLQAQRDAMTRAAKAFGKVNLAAKETDNPAEDADSKAKKDEAEDTEHNQVLGLVVGLFEIGARQRAFEMIEWFTSRGVDPLQYTPLVEEVCALVHAMLSKLYAPLSLQSMALVPGTCEREAYDESLALQPTEDDAWLEELTAMLITLGPHLHHDSFLFTKILRVVAAATAARAPGDSAWLARLEPLLTNTAFQLWELLKGFPFDERYRLYQQWAVTYATRPALQLMEAHCVQETRRVMRRLTADRAKPSARTLTHVAHSNPLVVFRTMLRQIQSYDNLIQPVVESFKFVTPLGMDVLSFVLVSELAKSSRQSIKADGTNISLWLASLANFTGSFYRKYPTVELSGVLQYLMQRLLQHWQSVDLVVLSELLAKMGSCVTFEDISAAQLEALAGGPHLWHEAPTDPKLTNRRAIPRLRDALVKRDLAIPLCLLICQVRSRMEAHQEADAQATTHLKALGRMYDTCQMTLSQLLQFLDGVVDPAVYTGMLPSVSELVQAYHIPPELAMTICRPAVRYADPILCKAPRSVHAAGAKTTPASSDVAARWALSSEALAADVAQAMVGATGKDPFVGMTRDMYVTFWSMTLYDIHVPFPQYEAEIARLRNSIASTASATGAAALTSSERKKLKEKTTQLIDKLLTEQKDQVAHRKRVFERLEATKHAFFQHEEINQQTAVNELLQKCVIPRALLAPEDALFCAKFMERVHHLNPPAFSAVQYYYRVALELPAVVLCVTEREAGNFGIFLKETLVLLHRWYQSSVTYDELVQGKTGFSVDLKDPSKVMTHRQYKAMFAKCHRATAQLYAATLASAEYMPIRNSLIVLTKVIDVFPAGRGAAEYLLEVVEPLTREDREDIKIMARRYHALLTKRRTTLVDDKLLSSGLQLSKKAVPVKEKADRKGGDEESQPQAEQEEGEEGEAEPSAEANGARDGSKKAKENDKKPTKPPTKDSKHDKDSDAASRRSGPSRDSGRSDSRRDGGRGSTGPSSSRDEAERESGEVPEIKKETAANSRVSSSSSSAAKLKRRDSDRAATPSSTEDRPKAQDSSDKRERERERGRGHERSTTATGKPSSGSDADSRGRRAESEMSSSKPPREKAARRSRSRSADRKASSAAASAGRERGPSPAPPKREPASSDKSTGAPSESAAGRGRTSTPDESAASEESRKRQRLESTEAALRRQLTEKKALARSSGTPKEDPQASGSSSSAKASEPPASSAATGASASQRSDNGPSSSEPSTRKIVSLVSSSSRKREREDGEVASGTPTRGGGDGAADEGASSQEPKRRREESDARGSRGADAQSNRRQGDDARRKQNQAQSGPHARQQQQQQQQQKQRNDNSSGDFKSSQQANNRDNHQSQRVGMAKDLLESWPRVVGDVLEEASEAIQTNLGRLMTEGPADRLTQTQFAQPAILSHSIAVLRVLQQERDFDVTEQASLAMGHSLGEYSALVATHAMPFDEAVRLVHFRGQAMQRAVPAGAGAMAALMPVTPESAEEICSLAAERTGLVCQVANYNSSKQSVISGDASAVEAAIAIAKTEKKVRRAVPLDVSAPFHCALMQPAATELAERLQATLPSLQPPRVPVVWNVEAEASEKDRQGIIDVLTKQVVEPVRWSQSVDYALAGGATSFLELGFGGVLSGLVKQHAPSAHTESLGTAEQLAAFLKQS
ncbi:hypothetical protein ATCC90586_009067 [Pythium insidiosum]|nr:hypothetical protein ATCC90586_009067 [Pythium insidiosum]